MEHGTGAQWVKTWKMIRDFMFALIFLCEKERSPSKIRMALYVYNVFALDAQKNCWLLSSIRKRRIIAIVYKLKLFSILINYSLFPNCINKMNDCFNLLPFARHSDIAIRNWELNECIAELVVHCVSSMNGETIWNHQL